MRKTAWAGVLLLTAILVMASRPAVSAELTINSGPGQVAGIHWDRLVLSYQPGSEPSTWQARAEGLVGPDGQALGLVRVSCMNSSRPLLDGCREGRLSWQFEDLALEADLVFENLEENWAINLEGSSWRLSASIPVARPEQASASALLEAFDLEAIPASLLAQAGLQVLLGEVTGTIEYARGQLKADLALSGGGFDSEDGLLAADGLALSTVIAIDLQSGTSAFSIDLTQFGGEVLAGPLYLPEPAEPLRLRLDGELPDERTIRFDRFELDDPGALGLTGSAALAHDEEAGWSLAEVNLSTLSMQLPGAFARWADGPASAAGFGGLETSGRVDGSLHWRADGPLAVDTRLANIFVEDPAGRFGFSEIDGTVAWKLAGPEIDLGWQGMGLYGLSFGPSSLRLVTGPGGARLVEPLRLPLLDGAFVIDRLVWNPDQDEGLVLDARIEPLSLTGLTRQLELPEFGGTLSGEFPGIVFDDDRLSFTGGIDMQAFSGSIRIENLDVERPFGPLPALSAQIEFSRLDLLELTGAFNFGRMEGQMSGWARDLRLLDWRPVAMDARVFTHDDARRRRISQRAVDDLASLGGAGAGLLTGTVLRVFDDFPYRRAGLACRLSNNICHIDGVAPHESGGFYIVQGRALPRLDVIGHRRLIDWPQLISQLMAITE
ncbi:MAG: hypothetical protein ACNA7J_00115 [Wenzhouxiangella sp.]